MKHEVNAMGKQCPIPVVMTKKVIDNAVVGDEIEILIDNETAVNNLSRLANKTGCTFVSEKLGDKKYQVKMAVQTEQTGGTLEEEEFVCEAPHKKVTVAVISSNVMGNGDDELGKILIKGFIYALSQMETHRIYLCPFSDGNTSGYNPFLQWRCKTYNRRLRKSGRSEKDGRRGRGNPDLRYLPEALWTDGETDGWKSYRYVYDCRAYDRCR